MLKDVKSAALPEPAEVAAALRERSRAHAEQDCFELGALDDCCCGWCDEAMPAQESSYQRIYRVTKRIPRGRVATYGQIAELARLAGHARQVGYALHALPAESDVPWHRVINAQGRISLRENDLAARMQAELLASEGVVFDSRGRVDLARYQWRPRTGG